MFVCLSFQHQFVYLDVAVNQEQIGRLLIEVNQYHKIVYSLIFNANVPGLYGSWKTWKVVEFNYCW